MRKTPINGNGRAYAHAMHVEGATEWLYVSGQVPADDNYGGTPQDFTDQARMTWSNIERRLNAVDMALSNLVKVTIYLSDRKYRDRNFEVRKAVLGDLGLALTIIIADIYDESWLLEIEAIAAR